MKSIEQLIEEITEDYFLMIVTAEDMSLQEQAFKMALADMAVKVLSQHLDKNEAA